MISISLCMIVKNEADTLPRALESVKGVADEIIIVDTGSEDRTVEAARNYTPHIYPFEWIDDFSAARNYSFAKATKDYCMWLDADDVLLPADRDALIALKNSLDPSVDIVMMRYHAAFDSSGSPTFSYYRERLIKNNRTYVWHGAVHEAITPAGSVFYSDIAVTHQKTKPGDPDRNLRIYTQLLERGESLDARERFYYAQELYYHQRYRESISVLAAFLDADDGWIENKLEACRTISFCYRALGDKKSALQALLRSLEFDIPRAELCCPIGAAFLEDGKYGQAAFWYQQALACERNDRSGAFVQPDCYGYLPYIQLCVCYYHLGDLPRAAAYNELAGKLRPEDPSYLYNKALFSSLKTAEV